MLTELTVEEHRDQDAFGLAVWQKKILTFLQVRASLQLNSKGGRFSESYQRLPTFSLLKIAPSLKLWDICYPRNLCSDSMSKLVNHSLTTSSISLSHEPYSELMTTSELRVKTVRKGGRTLTSCWFNSGEKRCSFTTPGHATNRPLKSLFVPETKADDQRLRCCFLCSTLPSLS